MKSLRKKPWNRVDQPVYSIASKAGDQANMNICSYVTPVSMKPKRFIVALYKNTLTLELVRKNPEFILQYLTRDQHRLINLLGKKSGHAIDKISRLKNQVTVYNDFVVLKDCLAYAHLKAVAWLDGGDHWCTLCDVVAYKNIQEAVPLTLNYLRDKKIIST
ncbi:MAG: flavin reductase family protein [Cyclobacteriaceae bacterium]|nr:flavin reductase family protein [Cyclobacteriaceae bacterium]UYN88175.1 MAG: flavin reductase family protein [Cyclobacteriaceae bacterium]